MAQVATWLGVGLMLLVLVGLQLAGGRALRSWGVQPSRTVVALRTVNTLVVIGLVAFVFWEWVIA